MIRSMVEEGEDETNTCRDQSNILKTVTELATMTESAISRAAWAALGPMMSRLQNSSEEALSSKSNAKRLL